MYRIGVDLGGTNIAAGIVSGDGKILIKKSVPFVIRETHDEVANDIVGLVNALFEEGGISAAQIISLGIGGPGTMDPPRGMILTAHNLKLYNMPVSHMLQRVLKLPVYVENDANCAALGESAFGAARGSKFSITITLGTGVGGGIIIGGRIYSGPFFAAGEMHQVIRADGRMCTCGRPGCWEEYASARGLIHEVTSRLQRLQSSKILAMADGDVSNISPKTVFAALDAGDSFAAYVIEQYIDNLCIGIGNLINILQPEIIVIGGGISGRGQSLADGINARLLDMVFGRDLRTKIAIAKLGNDAGIIGAAMLNK